jgi:transcriptional regulator with XRE-family HTH domain
MNFGERVHLMRRRRKMTQTELGKAIGVSKTTIFRIEGGEFSDASQQIARMARALNVSADYLLGLKEEPEPLEPEPVEEGGTGKVTSRKRSRVTYPPTIQETPSESR